MSKLCRLGTLACALTSVLAAQDAGAVSHGISGYSGQNGITCSHCHFSGIIPSVSISGPTVVMPGQTNTYTLTISGGQQIAGGLDVSSDGGALSVADPGTHLQGGEITHDGPRIVDGNSQVIFSFNWTAPLSSGDFTLFGAGNSVNFNGSTSGDAPDSNTLAIAVGTSGPSPGEPSGEFLDPMLVTGYDQATGNLSLAYGAACGATSHNLYYGPLDQVSIYDYTGAACDIGNSGTYSGFDPGPDSHFFLIVGTRDPDEGSYGASRMPDGSENERPAFTASFCGQSQTLADRCDATPPPLGRLNSHSND